MARKILLSSAVVGLLVAIRQPAISQCEQQFRRGDSNADARVDLSDPIFTLGFLFLGSARPACLDAADADDTGAIDLSDAISVILFLFAGGDPLPAPGPELCGVDPTVDELTCDAGAPCEPVPGCGSCRSNEECRKGFYCLKDIGNCDGEGKCSEIPPGACPENFTPVCGCDGQTYANDCFAAAAGVNIAFEGECNAEGCFSTEECPEGYFCAKAEGDCGGRGGCKEMPVACEKILDPVCGCDGVTYDNDCLAYTAGVSVAYRGACDQGISCADTGECPRGYFCAKQAGDCDGKGVCSVRPDACIAVFDPVCGCDGQTYGNACEAAVAGVSVAHAGECVPSCGAEPCPPGTYCARAEGDCAGEGQCLQRPEICPLIFKPVCGCDDQTYGNACEAAAAGVSVQHDGPCEGPPPQEE